MGTGSLAEFFGVDKVDFKLMNPQDALRRTAHLVIDVQTVFVHHRRRGNEITEHVADRIAELTPTFKDAGVKPYWIYYGRSRLWPRRLDLPGFYKVNPDNDPVVRKHHDSAFKGSDIHQILQRDGVQNLLVSGFNTSACVRKTVLSALKMKYNVCVLEDMTENGPAPVCAAYTLRELEKKGATVADSARVLDYIKTMACA